MPLSDEVERPSSRPAAFFREPSEPLSVAFSHHRAATFAAVGREAQTTMVGDESEPRVMRVPADLESAH